MSTRRTSKPTGKGSRTSGTSRAAGASGRKASARKKPAETKRPAAKKTGTRQSSAKSKARRAGDTASGKGGGRRWPLRVAKWLAVAAIWGVVIGGVGLAWISWDLPEIDTLAPAEAGSKRQAVTLLAADGSQLAAYGDLWGRRLAVDELPPHLSQAVMAIEDRRFYDHPGVDWRGILRATVANVRAGRVTQGGSTLTQQLAKNLFLTPERSLERKLKEAVLAVRLERRFSKDEILTIYVNRVYLGAGTYGVEAAAQRYFGRSAREIGIYEAALLAGLLKAPSRYNPRNDPKAARGRAAVVLDAMVDAGFLTGEAAAAERKRGARGIAASKGTGGGARYFTDWALDRASGYAGATTADLAVTTTLDLRLQAAAEQIAGRAAKAGVQVALVAMSPDGAVRAMIGGADYRKSQFNRATQALRQPGSAFKPLVYLPALESGMRPDTRIEDAPITIDKWTPENFTRRYRGPVSLREGMAQSLNTVAVRVAENVGRDRVVRAARRLGITAELTPHPSLSLGASEVTLLELTAVYAVFANGGIGVTPYGVREIRAGDSTLYRGSARQPVRVIEPEVAALMTDLLTAVVRDGTGRAARLDRPVAGKTGTSQDFRDAWFVGYTGGLVAGIWIGHDDGTPLKIGGKPVSGGGLPAQLWRDFMASAPAEAALASAPPRKEVSSRGFGAVLRDLAGSGKNRAEAEPDPTFVEHLAD